MNENDVAIKLENVSKQYRLGAIGGATLKGELQSKLAKMRHREDPNLKIGAQVYDKNEKFMALDDLSFSVNKGEAIGIIGHNGAGKSTLLKLISRVTAPTSGTIYMNGRLTSMLEVGTGFHPELTGRENVYLNGAILGMTKKEIDKKFDQIVEFSEVAQFIDTPVKRYSSGMYVKLAFSVASHLDSEIMIMDEVLAVGDVAFQNKCLQKMNDASTIDGKTILYVSHNMDTIRKLCRRCIVLEHGKKIFEGETEAAIGVYLKNNSEFQYSIDNELSLLPRFNEYINDKFVLERIRINNKASNIFNMGDSLNFSLNWTTKIEEECVYFKVIILSANNNGIGFADVKSKNHKGSNNADFIMDISELMPGTYKLSMIAYSCESDGRIVRHDVVDDCLYFTVMSSGSKAYSGEWYKEWGYANLNNLVCVDGE